MAQLPVGPVAGCPVSGTRRTPFPSYAEPSRLHASQKGSTGGCRRVGGYRPIRLLDDPRRSPPSRPRVDETTGLDVAAPGPEPHTTTAPSTHGPIDSPPLPAPGPGFVAGQVTAVGDSVMLDYQADLEWDIPGVDVQASVSRQWTTGLTLLQQAKSANQLGAVVIVGLGTNGPITTAQFDAMMSVLSGASRVVFVNVFVDRGWQDPNNEVLATGVHKYPNAVLTDWYTLASQNPSWLYSTGTHLPIGGPGAQALAAMVAADA